MTTWSSGPGHPAEARGGGGRATVLRLGAAVLVLAAVVLAGVALLVDPSPSNVATPAEEPTDVALPDLGLFGGRVTVYGAAGPDDATAPLDLDCRLVDADGDELSSAKMSAFATTRAPVRVAGQELAPLFTVNGYPDGSRVQCPGAASLEPVAVSTASTFGALAGTVRGFAAVLSLVCLAVAALGLLLARRR